MTVPIVRQALYLEVADRLRDMIRSRALAAGAWIDEAALTGLLGISRTPLREALKVLATEGLVRLEPGRGCFVSELSVADLEQIFPLMAMLEGRCAYEAAQKASASDLKALEPLHRALRTHAAAGRIDDYYEANARIHEAVQALADNRWLSDMVGGLRKVLSLFRHKSLALPGRIEESCAEHLAIFAALKARDPEGAEALARKHLLRQFDALRTLATQEAVPAAAPAVPNLISHLALPESDAHARPRNARPRARPARP
ncbi:GntR family transcriptional regulator [Bordetella ansorpii]|uniref:GntR family transcriptional regulator n=1 Tax=Bordetella ansorpii TaxID=288768 RepID=A0A157SPX5_9BORD|nr:GntR family transcriptional regulator [Bordetella ansorpii]SAI72351.1 GntR family transcriptional regulator [Bordetella ansorpii]